MPAMSCTMSKSLTRANVIQREMGNTKDLIEPYMIFYLHCPIEEEVMAFMCHLPIIHQFTIWQDTPLMG